MKKYRVEFSASGHYNGIFETIDEIAEIEADNAAEAIELAIDWMAHTEYDAYASGNEDEGVAEYMYNEDGEIDFDRIEEHYREYAWYAQEIIVDECGDTVFGKREYMD